MFSLALLVVATSQSHAGQWPSGSVVWSNSSIGTFFETAQRLPNGDVIVVVPGWSASGSEGNGNWNLTCFSRVTGEATWTTVMPFSWDDVEHSPGITIAVAQTSSLPNQRTMFEPPRSPVALIVYKAGFDRQQMLAVNTITGEIVMHHKAVPLNASLAYSNDAGFVLASGPQFYNDHYQTGHMQVAVTTIPSGHVLANFTLFPFTPDAKCETLHQQGACLAQSGCVWLPVGQYESCLSVEWDVGAIAVVPPHYSKQNPASGAKLVGLVGTRAWPNVPPFTGIEGTLFAIEENIGQTHNQIRWRVDNVTASDMFVLSGIVIVQLSTRVHTLRGYSLADGELLWQRSKPLAKALQSNPLQPRSLGPWACEVVCGQPCSLLATTNNSFGVIDPRTGETVAPMPASAKGVYATAGGIEYTVSCRPRVGVRGRMLWD